MIKTEYRNPGTMNIDKMSSLEMMKAMQRENVNAALAVESELESIARAVDEISARMKNGGRIIYVGCGTSGRLGVLDAAECPPTFGVSRDTVIGIIAGGYGALVDASEGAEDNFEAGVNDVAAYNITANDTVVGISVAGGASYVCGALTKAKEHGALTVAISSNEGCKIEGIADIGIHPDTGAEAITGSTRLKAGSAHKMILNMISTGVMVKMGYVYENLMINLKPTNIKLRDRMIRIVKDITCVDYDSAEKLLEDNGFVIKDAVNAFKGGTVQ